MFILLLELELDLEVEDEFVLYWTDILFNCLFNSFILLNVLDKVENIFSNVDGLFSLWLLLLLLLLLFELLWLLLFDPVNNFIRLYTRPPV